MNLVLTCPYCRRQLETDSSYAGLPISCPLCDAEFQVPGNPAPSPTSPHFAGTKRRRPSSAPPWIVYGLPVLVGLSFIVLLGGMAGAAGVAVIVGFLFFWLLFAFFYMLPSIIAKNEGVRHLAAIQALNIFLGWTLFGWVGALVWALVEAAEARRIDKGHSGQSGTGRYRMAFGRTRRITSYDTDRYQTAQSFGEKATPQTIEAEEVIAFLRE